MKCLEASKKHNGKIAQMQDKDGNPVETQEETPKIQQQRKAIDKVLDYMIEHLEGARAVEGIQSKEVEFRLLQELASAGWCVCDGAKGMLVFVGIPEISA